MFTRFKKDVTAKFGLTRGLRLTPPMYREHDDFAADENGNLFKVLANECMEQLYDDNTDGKFGSVGFLSFARLHHMNLHYLEAELAAELVNILKNKDTDRQQMMRVREKLQEYSTAITDYERVLNYGKQPPKGKLTAFHMCILPPKFKKLIEDPKYTWDNGYITLTSRNPWGTALASRIGAAFLGGAALVVPMVIMAVNDAPSRNLITTSVAVVLVAICLASTSLGTWRDVLGLTAAYAAVLIVFVGTSTSPAAGFTSNRT